MSWQAAAFLIVVAVVLAGFAWYERSRPPAQIVALVAALAALAIAGRIAFAAFPNVKPTTDIVIFAGYALGAAPGFAVGALTALVSNFWFGQGPWTPWQMAGWGLCGILGAALALGGRRVGRLGLAAACGLAGIAYGALLNFSLMATYGGDLTLERFLALQARAVPFDIAHAAGNIVLALVAGPAIVRMLTRFRLRFEWRRPESGALPAADPLRRAAAASLVLLALALAAPMPAAASDASRARGWLVAQQNGDGGWGASPGDRSSATMTGWAILGLAASGRNPYDVNRRGNSPLDYLRRNLDDISSTGDIARTILALQSAGADPRDFGGRNLISDLLRRRRRNGSFEGWPGTTAFSVIALREAGTSGGLRETISWLARVQNDDGGWGDVPGSPSTADGTAAVMQAIPDTKVARRGLSYLRRAQRPSGGFAIGGSGVTNSQSTGWAVQGVLALGVKVRSLRSDGKSPYTYLASRQAADGHYRYSPASDQTPVWVTAQALVAVSGKHFPIAPPKRAPATTRAPAGSGAGVTRASSGGADPARRSSPPFPPASAAAPPARSGGGGAGTLPGLPTPGSAAPEAAVPPATPWVPGAEEEAPDPSLGGPVTAGEPTAAEEGSEGSDSPVAAAGLGVALGAALFGGGWWLLRRYGYIA